MPSVNQIVSGNNLPALAKMVQNISQTDYDAMTKKKSQHYSESYPTKKVMAEYLFHTETGTGIKLKKNKVIRGCGRLVVIKKPLRHLVNGKYIELNKLRDNILSVKYQRNDTYVSSLKSQKISKDVKDIIDDIIASKYNVRIFDKLSPDDKRLVKRLVKTLDIEDIIPTNNSNDEEFQKQFDILRGELMSGNTNPQIKTQLKKYVIEALNSGLMPLRECHLLLYQLSL